MFTSMFALEMLLKLLACGPLGYIRNPYNIFDGIIVVIRWVPSSPGAWGGSSVHHSPRRWQSPHHWERPCRQGAEVGSPGAGPSPLLKGRVGCTW